MSGKILIVDALSAGSGRRTSSRDSIGCGPRTVAGVLEKHAIPCRIVRIEDILDVKGRFRGISHLAISAMTMDIPAVKHIIRIWQGSRPKGKCIVGGPIASDPRNTFPQLQPDVMVLGEGEATLDELLISDFLTEKIDLSRISGIAYQVEKSVRVNEPRPLLTSEELALYTPSTVRIMDYKAYQASRVYVEVVRGCSNFRRTSLQLPDNRQCSDCSNCDSLDPVDRMNCPEDIPPGCGFCSVPTTWGPPRSRTIKTVISEIEDLLRLDVHRIVMEAPGFLDYMRGDEPITNPCEPKANMRAITELLTGITSLPEFEAELAHLTIENMKACLFTEEVAKVLSEYLPSTSPNIGLETGSENHTQQIGKCGTPEDVLRAVKIAKTFGMTPYVYFIYGLPGETSETVDESIKMMRMISDAGVERIIMYGFRALPDSAFADFPQPGPDYELGRRMREEAARINRSKKDRYLDTTIRGIAAEPSWTKHGYTMVYPLGE
ncbi:MAG: radical SAM protein, partial [Candidatus Thorarchaeota archaeon]